MEFTRKPWRFSCANRSFSGRATLISSDSYLRCLDWKKRNQLLLLGKNDVWDSYNKSWNEMFQTQKHIVFIAVEKKNNLKTTMARWFKVTFLTPSWRSLNPFKRSLNHPKKVTLNHQGMTFFFDACSEMIDLQLVTFVWLTFFYHGYHGPSRHDDQPPNDGPSILGSPAFSAISSHMMRTRFNDP